MFYNAMLFCLCARGREVQPVLPQWVHVVSQVSQGNEESRLVLFHHLTAILKKKVRENLGTLIKNI